MAPRSEPQPADTLGHILSNATELFVKNGYRGISMREIGEAAGISKAGLYYHFRDKEDLFLALLRSSLAEVAGIVARAEAAHGDIRSRVRQMMGEILALPASQRGLIRMAGQEVVHLDPDVRRGFEESYHAQFVGRIAAMLAEARSKGEIRAVEPILGAWLLLGMAYPFFSGDRAPGSTAEAAEWICRVFFDGLAADRDAAV